MKRKALGRGLSAILAESPVQQQEQHTIQEISTEAIRVNHLQPRTSFDEESLQELSDSVRQQGILQPLLVRPDPESEGQYQVIAGERRLRASKMAGLPSVPCVVLNAEESQMLAITLVENIQRSNLNPVEEARAYKVLGDQSSLTQEEISARVGKSRETIANFLRLLNLPESTLQMLEDGRISQGHAKCLLALKDPQTIENVTEEIIKNGLSVRQTEKRVADLKAGKPEQKEEKKPEPQKDSNISDLEQALERDFNTKVRVRMQGKKKGKVEIHFYDLDQLDGLLKQWNVDYK